MSSPPVDHFAAVPDPPLDRFVESIWAVRGVNTQERWAVLPNGAIQLMVNFGPAHAVVAFGTRTVARDCAVAWIAGLQEAPLAIASPSSTDLLAIRFRPGGAHAFLPVPPAAFVNDVVDADAVLGSCLRELRERLALAPDRAAQLRVAQAWLRARLRPREHELVLVERALAMLERRERPESIAGACERLGVSNRRLIRMFRHVVGLPPKSFARIRRFHAALRALPAATARAPLALDLGYADQAHFNHEFHRLSGVTPSQYLRCRGPDDESLLLDQL